MKKLKFFIIISALMMTLFGCGISKENALIKSEEAAEKQFTIIKEVNETVDHLNFYLNSKLTIDETFENNLLLTKGNHPIVLFYNPVIGKNGNELYEQAKVTKREIVKDKTFASDDRKDEFGYLLMIDNESEKEDEFEVIVGIGGIKATTVANTKELEQLTELMMELVSSAQLTE